MAKELYLYSPIFDFTAESLIASMEEHKSDDIVLRINTPGGNVFAGWGLIAKIQEIQSEGTKVTMKVDGSAMSMGAFMLVYADKVEALDVSTFLFHRADMFIETEEDKAFLDRINKDLKAKLLMKIDAKAFKEITGISIDEMFNSEKRIDVVLDSKQAKKIGIVTSITKANPKEIKALNEKFYSIAAQAEPIIKTPKKNTMTLETLKAEHPDLFAQIVAIGVANEKDRAGAWLAFIDVDAKAVTEGVKGEKPLSATAMAEFSRKAMSADALKKIEGDAAGMLTTEEIEAKAKTEKQQKIDSFEKEVKAELGLKVN